MLKQSKRMMMVPIGIGRLRSVCTPAEAEDKGASSTKALSQFKETTHDRIGTW
ncbi:hypothetical protein [Paenibacillus sacheonensis]|uniref:Uncharacterized protein n=1 Tax=Paenibacillus sacheonensis TaxID=742054 RepID=A0A7X5C236_9BACL|nr:hypothetical protein [Paenibacillus sacheonensis]MBM7569450.1 hypothetical protein [Paenibacillus sacheonensis]NBC73381.1 hypothetical protein [Paenibacillus sacheonensis]